MIYLQWCESIKETDNLSCELYYSSATFFAMTGDYDVADKVIDKALAYYKDHSYTSFLNYPREKEIHLTTSQKNIC